MIIYDNTKQKDCYLGLFVLKVTMSKEIRDP